MHVQVVVKSQYFRERVEQTELAELWAELDADGDGKVTTDLSQGLEFK